MDKKELEAKLLECVATIYDVEGKEISMQTDIKKELDDASIMMVALVSSIENELDVLLPLPTAAAATTIGDIADEVEKLM